MPRPSQQTPDRIPRCLDCLAQVRHGNIDFDDFEVADRSKCRVCNLGFRKLRCSVDLPSCFARRPMTPSTQNVFAAEPPQQRWQAALLLVAGGVGAHTRWAASKNLMSPG